VIPLYSSRSVALGSNLAVVANRLGNFKSIALRVLRIMTSRKSSRSRSLFAGVLEIRVLQHHGIDIME
jgi:hypothetical protein